MATSDPTAASRPAPSRVSQSGVARMKPAAHHCPFGRQRETERSLRRRGRSSERNEGHSHEDRSTAIDSAQDHRSGDKQEGCARCGRPSVRRGSVTEAQEALRVRVVRHSRSLTAGAPPGCLPSSGWSRSTFPVRAASSFAGVRGRACCQGRFRPLLWSPPAPTLVGTFGAAPDDRGHRRPRRGRRVTRGVERGDRRRGGDLRCGAAAEQLLPLPHRARRRNRRRPR